MTTEAATCWLSLNERTCQRNKSIRCKTQNDAHDVTYLLLQHLTLVGQRGLSGRVQEIDDEREARLAIGSFLCDGRLRAHLVRPQFQLSRRQRRERHLQTEISKMPEKSKKKNAETS